MSEEKCYQATHKEIVDSAREHYERVSSAGLAWCSTVGFAFDWYEKKPETEAKIASLESSLKSERELRQKAEAELKGWTDSSEERRKHLEMMSEERRFFMDRAEAAEAALAAYKKESLEVVDMKDARITELLAKLAEYEKPTGEAELDEALLCLESRGTCLVTGAHSNSDCERMKDIVVAAYRQLRNRLLDVVDLKDKERSRAEALEKAAREFIKAAGVEKTEAVRWKQIALEAKRAIGHIMRLTSPVINDGDLRRTLYDIETAACADMGLIEQMIRQSAPALSLPAQAEEGNTLSCNPRCTYNTSQRTPFSYICEKHRPAAVDKPEE